MTPLLPLLLLLSSAALALNPIVVKGNLFFDSVTGGQFWARGVGYQPKKPNSINYDVLADQATIDRDLPYLINLGVNCIRVYETYATENHDYAMGKLEAAGIYVMLDVPTSLPGQSIDTNSPAWNQDLFEVFKAKVDAFSKYTNVLAYIASNEVSNQPNNTAGSAFVKAAVRDVKAYVRSKSLTTPVGYAIADAGSIVADQESYFACGDAASTPDFYGINIYRWCGNSSYTQSGYDTVTATFTNWPIAVLFSEYGCNIVRPRLFSEVNALYGSQMSSVFSGGIVYEYSQEENNYGLVQINFNNNTVTDIDFSNYKQRLTEINPTGTTMSAYTPTPKTITCPTVQAGVWEAVATPLPPAINEDYCACVLSSLTCRANATSAIDLIANRTKDVVSAYGYVCGLPGGYCADISANAKTGDYGGLSMCDALVRVSAVMNNFYMAQTPVAATNCAFNGLGKIQTPSTTMATCRSTYSISSSTVMTSSSTTGTGTGTASTAGSTTASTTGTGAGTGSTTTGGSTTTTRGSETSTSNTRGTSVNDESSANMLAATFTLLFLALFL